ncbi:MAG: tRNA 4-thiouridine(8) synthase ThiI [Methanobacteriota archaeon]|nr:MAG: tRNA 4-thiouridine(8) synthase ThiI [Euryarchaeota archaeon]
MRSVLLLSDGIDSPVAGYQMGQQGVDLVALHFTTSAGDADSQTDRTVAIINHLEKALDARIVTFIAPHTETLAVLSTECKRNLTCVLCKRMMLRIAGRLAGEVEAAFVITGDSLGQVASQTLSNLFVEEQATSTPILRPLIGMDKVEITNISKKIGTYDLSTCSNIPCSYAPDRPSTHCSLAEAEEEETKVDIESIAGNVRDRMRKIE